MCTVRILHRRVDQFSCIYVVSGFAMAYPKADSGFLLLLKKRWDW